MLDKRIMFSISSDIEPDTPYHLFMNASRDPRKQMPDYQFLTNHAQVLLCVARDPGIRLRDIAEAVGVTERSAHRIVSQLVEDGYVVRERTGRRNVYKVKPELPLLHPLAQETEQRRVGDLLEVLLGKDRRGPARRQRQRTA